MQQELIFSTNHKEICYYIYDEILKLNYPNILLKKYETSHDIHILLNYVNNKQNTIKTLVKHLLIDYIKSTYKYQYFSLRLRNKAYNHELFIMFIKTLCKYDSVTDVLFLENCLKLNNYFYFDSFLTFKMLDLYSHWQKTINITNDNLNFRVSSNKLLEITKYMLSTIKKTNTKLKIIDNNGKYSIYEIKNNILEEKLSEISDYNNLVLKLIDLCPKHIYIYTNRQNSNYEYLLTVYNENITLYSH